MWLARLLISKLVCICTCIFDYPLLYMYVRASFSAHFHQMVGLK